MLNQNSLLYRLRSRHRTVRFTGGRGGLIIEMPHGVTDEVALAIHQGIEPGRGLEINLYDLLRQKIRLEMDGEFHAR